MRTLSIEDIKEAVKLLEDQNCINREIDDAWARMTREEKSWFAAQHGHFLSFSQNAELFEPDNLDNAINIRESGMMKVMAKIPLYTGM